MSTGLQQQAPHCAELAPQVRICRDSANGKLVAVKKLKKSEMVRRGQVRRELERCHASECMLGDRRWQVPEQRGFARLSGRPEAPRELPLTGHASLLLDGLWETGPSEQEKLL